MLTLYHHPMSPHSRFVRLALGEYRIAAELREEAPWERRHDFLVLNPAGTLPVLVDADGVVVAGAGPIVEYLDETRGGGLSEHRLMPRSAPDRAEVRRLIAWFNEKLYAEVTEHLVMEKVYKLQMREIDGDRSPNASAIRAARANIRYHVRYVGFLAGQRNWLAGDRISYADLAAAAHLSVADYLGEVPWAEDDAAKEWYARVKSRPSFRPILNDIVRGMPPAAAYSDLDF